jgi:transposase
MGFVEGVQREQLILFPQSLDDYIDQDNPVRFIDAFVDALDMVQLGFRHAVPQQTGRPPYDPRMMMKLYLYGYLNQARSSRKLARECRRNVEVMWLTRKLSPSFKTIADFRHQNGVPIRLVCRHFTLLCRQLDLFGRELVAIDGSKFKAVNNRQRNFTPKKLDRLIQRIDDNIQRYLDAMNANDAQEPDSPRPSAQQLEDKIAKLKQRRAKYARYQQQIEESDQTQISLTDPDSRSMPRSGAPGTEIAYNVQIAVDGKHSLIVHHDAVQDVTDQNQLASIAMGAKQVLQVDELDALGDRGYYDGQEVQACLNAGITPYIPKPETSANKKRGLFAKSDFRYHAQDDTYECPAGARLTFCFDATEKGREIRYYKTAACKDCLIRDQCTRNKDGRRITRWLHEHLLDEMELRVRTEPEKAKRRKAIAEHPFGTIKHSMNQGYFLTKGLPNVRTEISLSVLAYNIKRAINILGVESLVSALTRSGTSFSFRPLLIRGARKRISCLLSASGMLDPAQFPHALASC